jgi:hypothetical protein
MANMCWLEARSIIHLTPPCSIAALSQVSRSCHEINAAGLASLIDISNHINLIDSHPGTPARYSFFRPASSSSS